MGFYAYIHTYIYIYILHIHVSCCKQLQAYCCLHHCTLESANLASATYIVLLVVLGGGGARVLLVPAQCETAHSESRYAIATCETGPGAFILTSSYITSIAEASFMIQDTRSVYLDTGVQRDIYIYTYIEIYKYIYIYILMHALCLFATS